MLEEKVRIEFARPSDAIEIGLISKNDIEYGLGWHYTPGKIKSVINNKSKNVIVARVNNNLAGFGIMTYYEDQANLDLLAVKYNYRRKRIGTQIVTWLEKVALTAGIFNIFVQCRKENEEAVEFYKKMGFITIDEEHGYYRRTETGIIMSKSLRRMFDPI